MSAGTNTTRQPEILKTASLQEPLLKIFLKIGYARYEA